MVDLDDPSYAGFKEALVDGTLKIHRAIDVEGLDYVFNGYDQYRDGHRIGFKSTSSLNKDYVKSVESQGMKTALGDAWGQRYFITWPDPAAKTA